MIIQILSAILFSITATSLLVSMEPPFGSPVKNRRGSIMQQWPEYQTVAAGVDAELAALPAEQRAEINRENTIWKRLGNLRAEELQREQVFREPGIRPRKRQANLGSLFQEEAERKRLPSK